MVIDIFSLQLISLKSHPFSQKRQYECPGIRAARLHSYSWTTRGALLDLRPRACSGNPTRPMAGGAVAGRGRNMNRRLADET